MKTPSLPDLIRFLSEPASYAGQVSSVRIIQTHISVVAVTDVFVYKLKKNVRFDFLDFSTLEKRHWYCTEEMRLNRRLAENLYVALLPVYCQNGKLRFQPPGEVVDYVIQMRRLSEEGLLVNQIHRPDFSLEKLDQLAGKLIRFYRSQSVSERIAAYGSAEKIQENMAEIIRSFPVATNVTLSPLAAAGFIEPYLRSFPNEHAAWFARRQQAGKITEGHGDLRCEHIHFQDDALTIYDCIEFSERLRCLDWLNDVAFLLMDLEHRRCVPYAAHLQDRMLAALETEPVGALLDFYKTYRACVRGKVHTLKAAETEVPPEVQAESRQKARQYFQLALHYTILGSAPTLIVCLGGVATGKTTVAKALADELGTRQLSSDVVRKQRAGVDVWERLPDAERQRLYTPQMTELVYEELARQGIAEARQSGAAVLDATYRQPEKLQHLQERCRQENIQLRVIETTAPLEAIRKRLARRETEPTASDMRLADYNPEQFSLAYPLEGYVNPVLQVNTLQPASHLLENEIFPWLIRQKEM